MSRVRAVNREHMLEAAADKSVVWDIVVIGGGATGLGVAVDAATRGYRTILLERADFAQATSSRSTKLIHGGVRYLQQGNIKLVREALYERGLLLRHAPHLVHPIEFVIPNYSWWSGFYYGVGLKMYDAMAGQYKIGRSHRLSKKQTLELIPTANANGLVGGTSYTDGQFDDARLAITLAHTAADAGATLLNYVPVIALRKSNGRVAGVVARDDETGREFELRARAVVNATGVFADSVRGLDGASKEKLIAPSQGAHIVLPRSFLPGETALMVPKTDDKRVLFAIPWHDRILVGTTDTPVTEIESEPRPLEAEIDFLLSHTSRYLTRAPKREDILCAFAGLRPLVKPPGAKQSALIPRDHLISVSNSGLITVVGGKWTTYRKMAEDTVNRAMAVASLTSQRCRTKELLLHGALRRDERLTNRLTPHPGPLPVEGRGRIGSEISAVGGVADDWLSVYGSDAAQIRELARERSEWAERLDAALPYIGAEVIWAARQEMARTVEDVLARRTRALFLDASASLRCAPNVGELLRVELGRSTEWAEAQVRAYTKTAKNYLPST